MMTGILLYLGIVLPIVFAVVELIGIAEGTKTDQVKWGLIATIIMSLPFIAIIITTN